MFPTIPWKILLCLGAALSVGIARSEEVEGRARYLEGSAGLKALFEQAPSSGRILDGVTEAEIARQDGRRRSYALLQREKLEQGWFAALLDPKTGFVIRERFGSWKAFADFVMERKALVEVWAMAEGGEEGRRLTAFELAELAQARQEPPTIVTVTFSEGEGTGLIRRRVEFGFGAAERVLEERRAYSRHRELQLEMAEVLGARDSRGQLNAIEQWNELQERLGMFDLLEAPAAPTGRGDLLVAAEFQVDEGGHFSRVVRLYRDKEITKRIVRDAEGRTEQFLELRAGNASRVASGFEPDSVTGELRPLPNPLLGQDLVELRIRDVNELEPRKWNVLEFGEGELLKQSALAQFSLLSAHLDRRRKEIALIKSRLDLWAEPVIASLNVAGGLAGWGFPAGEAARLGYNLLTPKFIADVPTVKELRGLFGMVAAKERVLDLRGKEVEFLTPADVERLKQASRQLSDRELEEHLERVSDEDLEAMLRLARMQQLDARISNFLGILTSVGKVTGVTERSVLRDIFNNPYFSLTGDVSLKTILAVAVGHRQATPLSGASLRDLSRGEGPTKAWLQYFDFSVDIRAVANTLARLPKKSFAEKELHKPFPYALEMNDLAAYEIRVFGYPLFIYYKRGLMKEDARAYEEDYAYAIDGGRIIAHFRTRAQMEEEIRARRMAPIGFVRVPDGKGGWKESNLAVFAYEWRKAQGKKRMAIVVYGLKAYQEHSQFIERELGRFQQYQKSLREGAVIVKLEDAEDRGEIEPKLFEPLILEGADPVREIYSPLLALHLEERRKKQIGASEREGDEATVKQRASHEERARQLQKRGYWSDGDELLGVDLHYSSFKYRTRVDGKWRVYTLTSIPSLKSIELALFKAEESFAIEQLRKETAQGKRLALIFVNQVATKEGRSEAGVLLADGDGRPGGVGVLSESQGVRNILEQFEELPIGERVKLKANHFAATLLNWDMIRAEPAAGAQPRRDSIPVLVTVEFPAGKTEQEWTNPRTGEVERKVYEEGLCRRIVTDRRITEVDYDSEGEESRSRTFSNGGNRSNPIAGVVIEETRTMQRWARSIGKMQDDPNRPLISKLRVNYVTGHLVQESYGAHALPVVVADEYFLTENTINTWGRLESARVTENGLDADDFDRPRLDKVLHPIQGRVRFTDRALGFEGPTAGVLAGRYEVARRDEIKGVTRTNVFDPGNFGRLIQQTFESVAGTNSFIIQRDVQYQPEFHFGLIPSATLESNPAVGVVLTAAETERYDPAKLEMVARVRDYTGKVSTNRWEGRWEGPVEVGSGGRRTVTRYNRDETEAESVTVAVGDGEELERSQARYDQEMLRWRVNRTVWQAPGITNRFEIQFFNSHGCWLSTRSSSGALETRPVYSASGVRQGQRTFYRPNAETEVLVREESRYEWAEGGRTALVRTFLNGVFHDVYQTRTDREGRVVADQIRTWPGLSLETVITYDGVSDRVTGSEQRQNERVRARSWVEGPVVPTNGGHQLRVRTEPFWGVASTQVFVLGDELSRPIRIDYAGGRSARVVEWHSGSAVPRVTEVSDRNGLLRERIERPTTGRPLAASHPEIGEGELPADVILRFGTNPWGGTGLRVREINLAGTDVLLFSEVHGERTYCNVGIPGAWPQFAVDIDGRKGFRVRIGEKEQAFVTRVFEVPLPRGALEAGRLGDDELTVRHVQLDGLFRSRVATQTIDRSGNVLRETSGYVNLLGTGGIEPAELIARARQAVPDKTLYHRYERGWLVESNNLGGNGRELRFTKRAPAENEKSFAVNEGNRRDLATHVDGFEPGSGGPADSVPFCYERSEFLGFHELNRHQPGRLDVWTAWRTARFGREGKKLYDIETTHGEAGAVATVKTFKETETGRPAIKVEHAVRRPREQEWRSVKAVEPGEYVLDLHGARDFRGADFLYFFIEGGTNKVEQITAGDGRGRSVLVGGTNGIVQFWRPGAANVQWLPNKTAPTQGAVVRLVEESERMESFVVLSAPELSAAGLDLGGLNSVRVRVRNAAEVRVTDLFVLSSGSAAGMKLAEQPEARGWEVISMGGGFIRTEIGLKSDERRRAYTGQYLESAVEFGGRPLAITRLAVKDSGFPDVLIVDHSDPDLLRPLYSFSPETGQFIEHYKASRQGEETRVYTISQGFGLPKLEVYGNVHLEDELSPDLAAYGYDYHAQVRYAKGRGTVSTSLATVLNRVGANMFKYGGDRVLELFRNADDKAPVESGIHYAMLHDARIQAHDVAGLPMFSEAVLPLVQLPWRNGTNVPSVAGELPQVDVRQLRMELLRLHVGKFWQNLTPTLPPTYLLPTALDTAAERFVDTVGQGELIQLAVELGETGLARSLLRFYWKQSEGGTRPLLSSYDAQSGTAMRTNVLFQRAMQSKPAAEAQLAIAEASLDLAFKTGEGSWLEFGTNLLGLVLNANPERVGFRPGLDAPRPRGITEHEFHRVRGTESLMLWPGPQRYTVRSNARCYVLLRKLGAIAREIGMDPIWSARVESDAEELGEWLRLHVLTEAEESGVIPQGVFEIQDVHGRTTALAAERWASTEDWLALLEAAHVMGLPRERTHKWLENLARVHAVQVGTQAGLDWTFPLLRPGAISSAQTAKFWRVARLLGHAPAEQFAARCLSSLWADGTIAVTATRIGQALPFATGQGSFIYPRSDGTGWPATFAAQKQLLQTDWNVEALRGFGTNWMRRSESGAEAGPDLEEEVQLFDDVTVFGAGAAAFYLALLGLTLFWWRFRALRGGKEPGIEPFVPSQLVADATMAKAEERWSKRVLGMRVPAGAERTRFSNATVEQNFLVPLRVIYKLVLEWRRQENGWDENDERLVEDGTDEWLNGMDEHSSVMGLYMRWVIKAGTKDGFRNSDVLAELEDSNHIWSRLVMYFSEHYWGLLTLMQSYSAAVIHEDKVHLHGQICELLKNMGVRQRVRSFDARELFNYPENPSGMDLLIVQRPGIKLSEVMLEASMKLKVPFTHLEGMIAKYKAFKHREKPEPVHPYLIELAKVLPHFVLMGIGALAFYNRGIGDSPMVPYVWSMLVEMFRPGEWPRTLPWMMPLAGALAMSLLARFTRIYRFEGSMLARQKPGLVLDATLTSFFIKKYSAMPEIKPGRWWHPEVYERVGWGLRAIGFFWLGVYLLRLPTPSFATFLLTKGILAMMAFAEVLGVLGPLGASAWSRFFQERASRTGALWITRFINRLNVTSTRPASPLWLSVKYHTQPSVPTGDFASMTQAVIFYFCLAAMFLVVGGYLCQEILAVWFTDTYLVASDWKLVLGSFLFWNTMYLLRYGLFLLCTGLGSALAAHPVRGAVGLAIVGALANEWILPRMGLGVGLPPGLEWIGGALAVVLVLAEDRIVRAWMRRSRGTDERTTLRAEAPGGLGAGTAGENFGVVYMGGDELSYLKLTPALLMERWRLLKGKLNSPGMGVEFGRGGVPGDDVLEQAFGRLYELESKHGITLWHPAQLMGNGEPARFRPELGLNLDAGAGRAEVLQAWHVRRWLVSMLSSAGHSQDTAVTLADMAVELEAGGLAKQTVFYLIQNKYDNAGNNRPAQLDYGKGELDQRNKLARLLMELAPGSRAYNIQNWTPFGFKAGGLTGMDLVPEETLGLRTMLILDRNATVHDLDALMADIRKVMNDPDVVIIIPGRGTTNTGTSIGQGSQLVEEGHRSFLTGLMGLLGGRASEGVGTGWGNLLGVYYGRVQRAMVDWRTLKRPLTSRMQRGSTFAMKAEGLIGFSPHAVGISEDTWAVSQAADTAVAFGLRPKFLLSRAFWHKIRETWSHAEWLASFPRWSGGYLQMMHDPLMQRINDFGAATVFAKEIRANSGRNFLSAPFALLNILLMPLAIMLDLTPFVQILVVLWNFGFVMNQVLTLNGLNSYLESAGFHKAGAVAGAIGGVALGLAWRPAGGLVFSLIAGGSLYGGFFAGLHRWLYYRMRDVILFGPQLVMHALGQVMRQTLEFVMSGASPADAKGVNMAFRAWAGPREDRPLDRYPHFINLRTVVWMVGLLSVILNLFALSNLDMLNALLLLPSLLFSVSTLIGPFIMKPKVGAPMGWGIVFPKIGAWICAVAGYTVISLMVAAGEWWTIVGAGLWLAVFGAITWAGLRYAGYRWALSRLEKRLIEELELAGLERSTATKTAVQLMENATGGIPQLESQVERAGIPGEHKDRVIQFLKEKVVPMMRKPVDDMRRSRFSESRFVSEFNRSFVLAMFVLIWFFVVPVPGLFVFAYGEYQISVQLGTIVGAVISGVIIVVAGFWLGCGVQYLERRGFGRGGLDQRIARKYQEFQELIKAPGDLSARDATALYAGFTEMKIYMDQASHGYASAVLDRMEERLAGEAAPLQKLPG